ncbi:FtsW/RodA/SpoVE family cell cycle protein [Arcobacter sp.]|uniref:FtsW/RodA/SpoVE family cell cycle protein n=1 Tax=Arcobacter sp. TaxID=1872629 RepID=UPI003C7503A6
MRFIDKRIISQFDYPLIAFIIPLIALSYQLVSEINENLAQRQLGYYALSIFLFLGVFILPLRRNLRIIPFLYWLGVGLLLCVNLFGISKLGAQRWIEIPFIDMTIQPSELIKPIFLLMIGYLVKNRPPPIGGYDLKDFLYFSIYILIPFVSIAKEPDLGTALILLLVGYGVLFIIGVNWRIWATIIVILGISSPFIYNNMIKDYQKQRIKDFISEEPSYHVQQSIIAIGSGGLTGKSSEDATQAQLKFLPIATSDFIFAYLVERHGYIGAILLILIYILLVLHLLSMNYYFSDDYVIRCFASGIALLVFLDMSVNIFMVIGFAPVVGLPLPLVSYGGSSFINFIVIFAILENLLAFRFMDLYNFERKL